MPLQPERFADVGNQASDAGADVPELWRSVLRDEFCQPYWRQLQEFLAAERSRHVIFPPPEDVYTAFRLTPPAAVRVVILGQDPYHRPGQAHGLAFSVRPGTPIPGSLRNILRELHDDLGIRMPAHGCLEAWARRGVLLLNTILTVREGEPLSHRGRGWEQFTDAVIQVVHDHGAPAVFVLWGAAAQTKQARIDRSRHRIVSSAHPSPLSAHQGFLGSRPFSRINDLLVELGHPPLDWSL